MFVIIPWKLESLNSCDWYLSVRLLQRIFMKDSDVELIVTLPANLKTFFWLGFELCESICCIYPVFIILSQNYFCLHADSALRPSVVLVYFWVTMTMPFKRLRINLRMTMVCSAVAQEPAQQSGTIFQKAQGIMDACLIPVTCTL